MSTPPGHRSAHSPRVSSCAASPACPYRLLQADGQPIALLNSFLLACSARGLSAATLRTYAFALRDAWQWLETGSHKLESLTEAHLQEYLQWLSARPGKRLAPRSLNLRLIVLRVLYRFQTGHDLPRSRGALTVRAGPAEKVVRAQLSYPRWTQPPLRSIRVRVPNQLPVALSVDQVATFLSSLRTYRDRALVALTLLCGLRSCELLALKLCDIDWDQKLIRVCGKGSKDRFVPMADPVVNVLLCYLKLQRPSATHDHLFVVLKGPRRGSPMTQAGLRSLFRYHRRRAGVPQANPHRFRHTFARELVRAGVPLPALMRLMGHSDMQMTLRYVNLSVQDLAQAVQQTFGNRGSILSPHE